MRGGTPVLSVVIPVWNEDPRNLRTLHDRLVRVLEGLAMPWEMSFVDDHSAAVTAQVLQAIAGGDSRVRVLRLGSRQGQEAALVAGLLEARGELICTMDSDLENRPEEIPRILAPLSQGYDLVLGTRHERAAWPLARRLASRVFKTVMNRRWGTCVGDWGCGFNAARRSVFEVLREPLNRWRDGSLKLELIRHASRWTEVEVTRDPRRYGRSGYSWVRLCWRGLRALTRGSRADEPSLARASIDPTGR